MRVGGLSAAVRPVLASACRALMSVELRNSLRLAVALEDRDRPPRQINSFDSKNVLMLAPHMDDEVAGAGGTLRLHVRAGTKVVVVFTTDGRRGYIEPGQPPLMGKDRVRAEQACIRTRRGESTAACKALGVYDLRFLDGPDGELSPTPALVDALRQIMAECRPEIVYHPSLFDLHEDHWQTNRLLAACLPRLSPQPPKLRGYEVWTPLLANSVADISSVAGDKRTAFQAFVSQNAIVDYPRTILGLNAYRSIHSACGRGFAEAFHETTPQVFLRLLERAATRR